MAYAQDRSPSPALLTSSRVEPQRTRAVDPVLEQGLRVVSRVRVIAHHDSALATNANDPYM